MFKQLFVQNTVVPNVNPHTGDIFNVLLQQRSTEKFKEYWPFLIGIALLLC